MPKQDFLFEIGTEELPPKTLLTLATALCHGIEKGLLDKGLQFAATKIFAAPRRLGVLVSDLDSQQPKQTVECRGPAIKAAYDADGKPTKAAMGFAKSCGVDFCTLQTQKTDKGEWLYYAATLPGKPTLELLGDVVNAAVKSLPITKPMRWGEHTIEFIRPVHWILMLLGKEVVPAEVLGKQAGRFTHGHRFHFPEALNIKAAADYESLLENKAHVIPDFGKRRMQIVNDIKKLATESNGLAIVDEELLDEVTAIVEYPQVLRASFADEFLQVPQEALIAAMQGHQKSFPVFDSEQGLLPYFIFVTNIKSKKPRSVIAGNEKVMHARLSDAAFFYKTDRKMPLVERLPTLKNVMFQKKLGNLYQRSERIAILSESVANAIGADTTQAKRAGLLCKCDLMSDMVYEFTELQGIMGAYYAQHDGEAEKVVQAIREHYQPEFSGDELPSEVVGVCVALADKLDLLVGVFGIGQRPTGDKDPFALRRAAIGVLRILIEKQLNLDLPSLITTVIAQYGNLDNAQTQADVLSYISERLKYWYLEQDITLPIFNAVVAKPLGDLNDFNKRILAVKHFSTLSVAENLAAANKRVSNILNKNSDQKSKQNVDEKLLQEPAEKALHTEIKRKQVDVKPLLAAKYYTAVLTSFADLQQPIDDFFDHVMVMSDDEALKNNRLALLKTLRSMFTEVADIAQLL